MESSRGARTEKVGLFGPVRSIYEALPTSLGSARLLGSISRLGDRLSISSSISAFVSLVLTGDETEEVFRRFLLAGSYRCKDRRLLRSFPSRLEVRDGLRYRRRGGVWLRLLLRVSRRSSRSPLRPPVRLATTSASSSRVGVVSAPSLLRDKLLRGVRLSDLEDERDLDLEGESRRALRDLGGGEGLKDEDVVDLLRFDGLGEREREDEGVGDRRVPRSGLCPLPRPPLPL